MKPDPIVFFHSDLDGIVSYLVLCWAVNKKLNYVATTPRNLSIDWEKWKNSNSTNGSIYFLDLDVTKIGEQIDLPNVVIVDHHKTNLYSFTKATRIVYNETSCAKIMYDTFFKNKQNNSLTNEQKTLVALADDWDSNTKATPLSEQLNIVYHSLTKKVESFIQDYYNGFKPFDKFKTNTILLYKKHKTEYLQTIQPFVGKLDFEGEPATVCAVFCDKFVSECCDYIFEKYNTDVAIAVLLEQKRIAARRNPNNTKIDISKFVQRVANGGGHESAAGGNLTDEFVEFTKLLKPVEK